MDTTIKINYKAFCKSIIETTKNIYGLTDKDLENLPMDLNVILKWQEKVQDDHIINELKKDNLDNVVEILKHRR